MDNNRTELESWINDYTEEMLRRAIYKVSNEEDAQDLVQDTFMAASKGIANFQRKSSPKTWLFTILNNKITDYYRKNGRAPKTADIDSISFFFDNYGEWNETQKPNNWDVDDTEQHLLDNLEFIEVLNYCIENLPQKFNEVVKQKYYSTKKTAEICKDLGISSTNIWQIMHRAKLALRKCIEKNWFIDN